MTNLTEKKEFLLDELLQLRWPARPAFNTKSVASNPRAAQR